MRRYALELDSDPVAVGKQDKMTDLFNKGKVSIQARVKTSPSPKK